MAVITSWSVGDASRNTTITTSAGITRIRLDQPVVTPKPTPKTMKDSLHDSSAVFGVVYANDLARVPISSASKSRFPVGSIIVREKLLKADDKEPELLAVMIKRERGYNPAGGDWSFLTVDGAMTRV